MDVHKKTLGAISGGRVLDLATGAGNFALSLAELLGSYEEIIGVDNVERAKAAFEKNAEGRRGLSFRLMDARALEFPDGSFDLVAVSNSLHHFENPEAPLAEAARVLRPGGRLVISEMHRDTTEEARLSHVLLHHYWAEVDRARGVFHGETFARDWFSSRPAAQGLELLSTEEILEDGDPLDPDTLKQIEGVMADYLNKAEALADSRGLLEKWELLMERVRRIGFLPAPGILLIARKPERL